MARGKRAIERRIFNACLCLSSWITNVFCAGVARLPKPRLAVFLGIHSPLLIAALLPGDLLLPSLAAFSAFLCFLVHGVLLQTLLDPLSNRFAPNSVYDDDCIRQIVGLSHK